MVLEELVKEHFDKMDKIGRLQEEKKEVDRQIFNKLIENQEFEFVTINWKKLHRFAYGHRARKG